ncbi:hypothetical protein [Kitasatospora sp. NPDC058046]|uniref:hypothetical protein n=1 Tax=Kitasatospora sp. NPDC058046 TaxID=3346312 RepID=UPI0036DF7ACB
MWTIPNTQLQPLYNAVGLDRHTRNDAWKAPLRAFAETLPLRRIVQHVLRDQDLLTTVAAVALRHPMGFDKLILLRDACGALIKIDVWWEEDDDWGTIHNHRFDFASTVLHGELRTRLFVDAAPATTGARTVDVYRLTVPQNPKDAVPQQRTLLPAWEGALPAGTTYDMRCEMFHMASGTRGRTTVTLVAQGAPRRTYSLATRDTPGLLPVTPMSVADVRERLERLEAL